MTLVNIPDSPYRSGHDKYKNPFWVGSPVTPNEKYQRDSRYHALIDRFCQAHKIEGQKKWFEVRITDQHVMTDIYNRWWNQRCFMDHIFWVFQKPDYSIRHGAFFYTLEPYEVWRVVKTGKLVTGLEEPFKKFQISLWVPVDACEVCIFTEFAGGYGEHRYFRPDVIKAQYEVDKEMKRKEDVRKLMEEAEDISTSPKWRGVFNEHSDPILKKRSKKNTDSR